jgi:hypothetical protein
VTCMTCVVFHNRFQCCSFVVKGVMVRTASADSCTVLFHLYNASSSSEEACILVHLPLILLPGFELYFWRLIVTSILQIHTAGNTHGLALGQDVHEVSTSTHL